MLPNQSVVLIGKHNPGIFSPAWIRSNGILETDDGAEPEIMIIHEEIADFAIAGIRIAVQRNRAKISSDVLQLYDLVGIINRLFGDVLPHTPLLAAGMNIETTEDLGQASRNKLGRALAPLAPWGEWAADFDNKDPRLNGGLASLVMRKPISIEPLVYIDFSVQPSRVEDLHLTHVRFAANNHIEIPDQGRGLPTLDVNATILQHLNTAHASFVEQFYRNVEHLRGAASAK